MKTIICILIAGTMAIGAKAQTDSKGMARVNKVLGIEVYVMSEPTREYTVVEKLTTNATTLLSKRESINKQVEEVINRAMKRKEKGKIGDFDGVITSDGDTMILVKFKS